MRLTKKDALMLDKLYLEAREGYLAKRDGITEDLKETLSRSIGIYTLDGKLVKVIRVRGDSK